MFLNLAELRLEVLGLPSWRNKGCLKGLSFVISCDREQ